MKKLSIEQKAKAYDEAIKRVENINTGKCKTTFMFTVGLFEYIFPELAESEDEKIRKGIVKYLEQSQFGEEHYQIDDDIVRGYIAWLEKKGEQKSVKVPKFKAGDFIQFNGMGHTRYTIKEVCGLSHYINTCDKRMDMSYTDANFELVEQKPVDKVEHKFKVGDVIRLKGSAAEYTIKKVTDTTYYTNGWSCGIERCEKDYELVKQKSSWSEEDERQYRAAIAICISLGHNDTADWLKSLRPQKNNWERVTKEIYFKEPVLVRRKNKSDSWEGYRVCNDHTLNPQTDECYIRIKDINNQKQWCPSDEQMVVLNDIIINGHLSNANERILKGLQEQLKKLREE